MVLIDAHWIEATTDQVLEVYRSTATMVPSGFATPCQAFVCVLRNEEGVRSCLAALFLKKSRKSVVFTETNGKLDAALAFAGQLGFTMEKVNLEYKASLREVILRDIPVLLTPQAAATMRCKAAEAELKVAGDAPAGKRQSALQAAEAEAEQEREEALAAARQLLACEDPLQPPSAAAGAKEKTARVAAKETEELERSASQQAAQAAKKARLLAEQKNREEQAEQERKAAQKAAMAREAAEQERLAEEHAAAAKAAAEAEARRRAQTEAASRKAQQEEAERMRVAAQRLAAQAALQAERQRLAEERQRAEAALQESELLQQQVQNVEALRLATEQRAAEAAETERLASERAQLAETAVAELAAAHARAMQEAQEEARNLQQLAAQQQEIWRAAARDAEVVAAEAQQLLEQADAARQVALAAMVAAESAELALRKMEAAERALQEAEELQEAELVELQHEDEPSLSVQATAVLSVPPPAAPVPSRPVAVPVSAESQAVAVPTTPTVLAPAIAASAAPVVPAAPLPTVASVDTEKLQRQVARSAAEERARAQRLTAEQGELILESTRRACVTREQAAEKRRLHAGPTSVHAAASEDPFAVLEGGAGEEEVATRFHLDERLVCIEYDTVEDIVEFHQSLNTVRLTPEHHPIQAGWATVAAIRQGGTIHVFIALLLIDSCEALVYVPSQQPQRAADYGPVMQEALNFVEVVGFMMDHENFQTGGENYAMVLRRKTSG